MKKSLFTIIGATSLLSVSLFGLTSCKDKSKTIEFWHCLGHDKTASLEKLADAFNKEHKDTDGFEIDLQQLSGDYSALHDNVKTKLSAGFTPAITMGYPDSFSEYMGENESESKIIKLDDFIKNDETFNKADFVDAFYDEGTHFQFEGTWCLPMYKSTEVMYINKNAFEGTQFYKNNKDKKIRELDKNGGKKYSPYAVVNNPNSWDIESLFYIGTQIYNEQQNQKQDFTAIGYDSDSNLFISQMAQRGIPYTTDQGSGKEHILFYDSTKQADKTDSKLVDLASELLELVNNKVLSTQATYGSYSSDNFLKNKTIITIGSTGGSSYNDPNGSTKGTFDATIYPVPCYYDSTNEKDDGTGGEIVRKYIQQGPDVCFFKQDNEDKMKATWEFYTKYLSSVEYNVGLSLINSYDPVRKAAFETDEYNDYINQGAVENDPNHQKILDAKVKMDKRIPNLTKKLRNYYMTTPVFYGSSTVRTEIGNVLKYANGSDKNKTTKEKINEAFDKAFNTIAASVL